MGAKIKLRKTMTRAPKVSAGVRPLAFPRPTLPRGLNRDFTYCYHGAINTSTTQNVYGTENYFKLNDIYDPTVGAEASQPLYYTEYAALYRRYRVYAVTVEVRWMCTDSSNVICCATSIQPSGSLTTLTGQQTNYVQEMPLTEVIRMSPGGEHTWLVGPRRFTLANIEGESWYTRGDDYEALFGASPAVQPYVRVAAANRAGTTQVAAMYDIRITYHTHLFNPKTPAESDP